MTSSTSFSRREFLRAGLATGAGLTIAFHLPGCSPKDRLGGSAAEGPPFEPNAFVRIGPDNSVTVVAKHLEMGQGIYTGLATIVAEELDADWAQVRVVGAPADAAKYNNLLWGPAQGTGGSTAIANSYQQLREAGAAARAMLIAAAAATWNVPAAEVSIKNGTLLHSSSGKKGSLGDFAAKAATMPAPEKPALKDKQDFVFVGKSVSRKDVAEKTTGKAIFTQDIQLPGMLTAVVAHPPRFGAKVKSFDASKAKAVPGVKEVVQIPNGVAVLADGFFAATRGRDALTIEWDHTGSMTDGSTEIFARYRELAKKPGTIARNDGDAQKALATAAHTVEASYEFPFLAHASMEPLNCVVQLGPTSCEIWNGEQLQTPDQFAIAAVTGLKPEQVTLHMLYAGGSFGRRANPKSDYLLEAVSIAKAIGGKAPVKMVWTREDDMTAGYFRPIYLHVMRGGVDGNGKPVAWLQRIVGQSIVAGTPFAMLIQNGIDPTSVEGASTLPYTIPNLHVDLHSPELPVPIQWWRSVGHTHTAFATEVFLDELAAAGKQDPFKLRQSLLAGHPRQLAVLEKAAEKSGWGSPLPAGHARGIAVHESFNSFVAEVAEVSLEGGQPKVHRVVCAVDCGIAVNPDIIRSQMEGGIAYGLSAALHGEITVQNGAVNQTNFHQYQVLRLPEMPVVEVHIIDSDAAPTGVGEPGVPPSAPAVANALFALTGKPVRRLPIRV